MKFQCKVGKDWEEAIYDYFCLLLLTLPSSPASAFASCTALFHKTIRIKKISLIAIAKLQQK